MEKILIVDDDLSQCLILKKHLADLGEVCLAESGAKAIELIQSEPFDLIVLDQKMPEMDGFEVLVELKSNPRWMDIPVIMITADNQPATEVAAFESGVSDFVCKPVIPQTLRARVMMQLELQRHRKQLISSYQQLEDEFKSRKR